jgi:hypothetical protein
VLLLVPVREVLNRVEGAEVPMEARLIQPDQQTYLIKVIDLNGSNLATAFHAVEDRYGHVQRILLNARTYAEVRRIGRDILDIETAPAKLREGLMAELWGSSVFVSREVDDGDIWFVGDDGHVPVVVRLQKFGMDRKAAWQRPPWFINLGDHETNVEVAGAYSRWRDGLSDKECRAVSFHLGAARIDLDPVRDKLRETRIMSREELDKAFQDALFAVHSDLSDAVKEEEMNFSIAKDRGLLLVSIYNRWRKRQPRAYRDRLGSLSESRGPLLVSASDALGIRDPKEAERRIVEIIDKAGAGHEAPKLGDFEDYEQRLDLVNQAVNQWLDDIREDEFVLWERMVDEPDLDMLLEHLDEGVEAHKLREVIERAIFAAYTEFAREVNMKIRPVQLDELKSKLDGFESQVTRFGLETVGEQREYLYNFYLGWLGDQSAEYHLKVAWTKRPIEHWPQKLLNAAREMGLRGRLEHELHPDQLLMEMCFLAGGKGHWEPPGVPQPTKQFKPFEDFPQGHKEQDPMPLFSDLPYDARRSAFMNQHEHWYEGLHDDLIPKWDEFKHRFKVRTAVERATFLMRGKTHLTIDIIEQAINYTCPSWAAKVYALHPSDGVEETTDERTNDKEKTMTGKLNDAFTGVLGFLRTAATEGAKDGASFTAADKARQIVKKKLGSNYPSWLQATAAGKIIDDVIIPTGLFLAADMFPSLPHAENIKAIAGRAARVAFQRHTSKALEHLMPMFDEIGKAITDEDDEPAPKKTRKKRTPKPKADDDDTAQAA